MSWRRALLITLLLVLLLPAGAWWWLLHSASGARFVFSRAAGLLEPRLEVDTISGGLASGVEMRGLKFATPELIVTVAELRGAVRVGLLPLTVTLSDVRARALDVARTGVESPGPASTPEALLQKLRLPLALVVDDAQVVDISWRSSATAEAMSIDRLAVAGRWSDAIDVERLSAAAGTLQADATGRISLAAPQQHVLSADIADSGPPVEELRNFDVHVETEGGLDDWQFELGGTAELRSIGPLRIAATGTGSLAAIDVRELVVDGPKLAATGDGRFEWGQAPAAARVAVEVTHADPQTLIDQWPAGYPVAGYAQASFAAGRIEVGASEIRVSGTDMVVRGSGLVDLDNGTVSSDLNWRALHWPVASPDPRIASSSGDIVLDGRLDDWSVSGKLALEAAGLEDGSFEIIGGGDRDSASARIVEGSVLGGTVAGNVAARWREPLNWSLDLDASNVSPGPIWPAYSGSLSGKVDARGRLQPLSFSARLQNVRGTVEGLALRADGVVDYDGELLSADNLVIRHGTTRLSLDGSMQGREGVRFAAYTDALENYANGISGDLQAEGSVKMREDVPVIDAEARSERLAIGNRELADTAIALSSIGLAQEIRGVTRLDELAIAIGLDGAFERYSAPFPWQGRIVSFTVDGGEQGSLNLDAPAPLRASAQGLETREFCLTGPAGARACADASWQRAGDLEVQARVEQLALNTVNRVVETGYRFDQKLDGELSVQLPAERAPTANAILRLSPGRIVGAEEPDLSLRTGEGALSLEIRDGELLYGELALPMPGTGVVRGELRVLDINDLPQSGVEGNLSVDVDDINFVRVVLPSLDRASGVVHADIELGGTVERPHASGEVVLQNGSLGYRPLGMNLDDLQLRSTFDADRRFVLEGTFRAGEGTGRLTSEGDYARLADSGIDVELTGRNLKLIDVPDVEAVADTDMRIGYRDKALRIDGSVTIPRARVSPESLPASRRSESEDVVIVAGEQPDAEEAVPDNPLRITGQLDVTLGNDVVVDLNVAEAKVSGSVRFQWREQLMPIANGRYTVTGDVEAYGQVLDITEGTIRFSKVPANNPTLRIRAEREIFGNSQVKVAGVLIDGTAKRPRIEPYTEPRTTEERALTLLVTGSDFDMEQGVGAIDFGTYIAPRLFVSYGVGLFDQENVISARYDLGRGFGVKATSGQSESGVDLIYRIER